MFPLKVVHDKFLKLKVNFTPSLKEEIKHMIEPMPTAAELIVIQCSPCSTPYYPQVNYSSYHTALGPASTWVQSKYWVWLLPVWWKMHSLLPGIHLITNGNWLFLNISVIFVSEVLSLYVSLLWTKALK